MSGGDLSDILCCRESVQRGMLSPCMTIDVIANECYQPALLTTMDVVSDGFGFMLSFGDLAWVPFLYSLQARYLAFHHYELDTPSLVAVVGLQVIGYWIFRASNGEKNDFRNGKNPKSKLSANQTRFFVNS